MESSFTRSGGILGATAWNDAKDKEWNILHNRVKGPFFCGISKKMVLPEYNIRLCGPTSTSKAVEIAQIWW